MTASFVISLIVTQISSSYSLADSAPVMLAFFAAAVSGLVSGIGFILSTCFRIYRGYTAKEEAVLERERPLLAHSDSTKSCSNFIRFITKDVDPSEIGAKI